MKTVRTRVLGNLPKIATIFACLLFLVSVFLPFLFIHYRFNLWDNDSYGVTYWSYKAGIKVLLFGMVVQTEETHWFTTYWFAEREPYSYLLPSTLGISWILIVMFLMQTLTVVLGFVTLFLHRKLAKLLPLIPCLFTIFLMIYVSIQVQNQIYGFMKYELGYWLCYPSAFLFLLAFLFPLAFYIHKKMKVKESTKDNVSVEADMDQ